MVPALKGTFSLSEADRAYFDRDDLVRIRVRANALLLGIVIYAPLGLFDIIAFPEDFRDFLVIRAIASIGIIAAYFWFRWATNRQQREAAIYTYCMFAVGGLLALSTLKSETAVYFHFGMAVAVFYGGVAFFVRPTLVFLIALTTFFLFVVSLFFSDQDPSLKVVDTVLMLIAIVTLVASNIYRHRLERADYVSSQALLQAKLDAEDSLKMALEADQAKDNLLAGVSHELRTPMNAIMGFSDAMRSELYGEIQPQAYRTYVEYIHSSSLILHRNINDILDLSSLSMGKVPLVETAFPLAEAVFNAVNLCIFRAKDVEIDLIVKGKDIDVLVFADQRRLEQAVINLTTNAIKFSQPGQHVTVEVHRPTGDGIEITVSDDGRGISKEALVTIKDPFVQEHTDNRKRGDGGMGIGLAIVTNIMESMDGSLTLQSTEGKGTTATLRLPVERIDNMAAPEATKIAQRQRLEAV